MDVDVQVTKTFLPPLEDYQRYVAEIFARGHITNHGPLVLELEERLRQALGVRHCFFVTNGTLALQIAFKALELSGSVATTPFSYVATTSALVWENLRPVFADVEPDTACLDVAATEAALAGDTQAILATHVYGNACDVAGFADLARRRGLKVIYDAAHAFGARLDGRALAGHGDIATLSFHATKLFHTIEGGAVVTDDDALAHRIAYLRNFGHNGPEAFWGLGINAKGSEMQAAMGLCVLPHVPRLIEARREASARYDAALAGLPLARPRLRAGLGYNHAYHPVFFETEAALLAARAALNAQRIFPRRYFYPSLSKLPYVERASVPVAESIASRVLCLPHHHAIEPALIDTIAATIRAAITT